MSRELQRIASPELPAPPAPPLPAEPLERLPHLPGDTDPYWRLVTAFLVGYPPHSSRAYFSDLKAWYMWCAQAGVHPLVARRHHVDVWVRHLSQAAQPATGRPASPASIARRLSCLSKFYDYGVKDAEVLEHSPVANVRRPKVSDDSSTVGLTADELDRFLAAAEAHGPRSTALVSLLVYNGLRIAEVLACDVEHLTHQRGHRVLRIMRKGGRASTEPVAPIVLRALEDYVAQRTSGPIFLNADGNARLSYSIAYKHIRRLAKRAGIASAARISPHSLRHSFATELLAAGVPSKTSKTPWATPTPAPPAATCPPTNTSTATPPTLSPPGCADPPATPPTTTAVPDEQPGAPGGRVVHVIAALGDGSQAQLVCAGRSLVTGHSAAARRR